MCDSTRVGICPDNFGGFLNSAEFAEITFKAFLWQQGHLPPNLSCGERH